MVNAYIQAVRSREALVEGYLRGALLSGGKQVGSVFVSYDEDMLGPAFNLISILERAKKDGKDALILQDDAVLHQEFWLHFPEVANVMRDKGAVSLFCPPRKVFYEAFSKNISWVANKRHLWQPGILLDYATCVGILKRASVRGFIVRGRYDEELISGYLKKEKRMMWVTVPSLVQHNTNVPSTIGTASSLPSTGKRVTRQWLKKIPEGHYQDSSNYLISK